MLLSSGCSAQHGTAPIWVAPSCGLHSAPAQHILRAPETAKVRIKPGGRASGPVGVQALLPTPLLQLAASADPASLSRAPCSSLNALAATAGGAPSAARATHQGGLAGVVGLHKTVHKGEW